MHAETIQVKNTIVTFKCEGRLDIGKETYIGHSKVSEPIFGWGSLNDLPTYRKKMIMDNNIVAELINTKRSIVLGQGLMAYTELFADGGKKIVPMAMPTEIADWMEEVELMDKYLEPAANELIMHANIFAAILPGDMPKLMVYKCEDTRAIMRNQGEPIPGYVVGTWNEKNAKHRRYVRITSTPNDRSEYIMHVGDKLLYDNYYYHPTYWGGEEWIDLSNQIPKFHKANIENGYTIRFHVKIPANAFLDKQAYQSAHADNNGAAINKCLSDADTKKKDFLQRLNDVLSGTDNSGRALITFFEIDDMGKAIEGVSIEPINFDMKDEALISLYEKSNQANISAMGIHPTLANVETQGKLSSGSEMRNALEIYTKIKARIPRDIILKPINAIWKMKEWHKKYPGVKLGFEDVVLTTLDVNPTGSANVIQRNG